jgi:hypothetical protein
MTVGFPLTMIDALPTIENLASVPDDEHAPGDARCDESAFVSNALERPASWTTEHQKPSLAAVLLFQGYGKSPLVP